MPDIVRCVALVSAVAMAVVTRIADSADARRDRARCAQLIELWEQVEARSESQAVS